MPAEPVASRQAIGPRYVLFAVGGVEYAVDASLVRRAVPAPSVPSPEMVVLGQVYPLVDLRTLFRLPPPATAGRQALLVHGESGRAGLLVDRLVELTGLDDAVVVPLPAVFRGVERRWFGGLARLGTRVVVVLRVDGILGTHAVLSPELAPRVVAAR